MRELDILVPTFARPGALAVTLLSLCEQDFKDFRVIISDQTEGEDAMESGEVKAVARFLRHLGHDVIAFKHLPRLGMAEQRNFLFEQAGAPYTLFVDDDLILEKNLIKRMMTTIKDEACGFVGSAPIGLSFLDDIRPDQQRIEFWNGPVRPEKVRPGMDGWNRWPLHSAANILHLAMELDLRPGNQKTYKVAWVGGCVLYDTAKLREAGGFAFWRQLPPDHAGEEIVVQLRLMERYGGCGIIPSGVYHQELPTTVENRRIDAPKAVGLY
jgi:glycosyltransferase involved in cell wall biosynthesis